MDSVKKAIKKASGGKKAKPPPPPKRIDTIIQGVPSRFVGVVRDVGRGKKSDKQRLLLVTKNMSTVFLGPNGLIDKMIPPADLDEIEFDNQSGNVTIQPKEEPPISVAFDNVNVDGKLVGVESQSRKDKLVEFISTVRTAMPHVPLTVRRSEDFEEEEEEYVEEEPEEPEIEEEPFRSEAPVQEREIDRGAFREEALPPQASFDVDRAIKDAEDYESIGSETSSDESDDGFELEAMELLKKAIEERERGLLLQHQLQEKKAHLSRIQETMLGGRQATHLAMLVGAICERQLKLRLQRASPAGVGDAPSPSPHGPQRVGSPNSAFGFHDQNRGRRVISYL